MSEKPNVYERPSHATDVQQFIADLDGGMFEKKLGMALSNVAAGVVDHNSPGQVTVTFNMKQIGNSATVIVAHKLSYKCPTSKGDQSENHTTSTPMHLAAGGKMTIFPVDQLDMFRRDDEKA